MRLKQNLQTIVISSFLLLLNQSAFARMQLAQAQVPCAGVGRCIKFIKRPPEPLIVPLPTGVRIVEMAFRSGSLNVATDVAGSSNADQVQASVRETANIFREPPTVIQTSLNVQPESESGTYLARSETTISGPTLAGRYIQLTNNCQVKALLSGSLESPEVTITDIASGTIDQALTNPEGNLLLPDGATIDGVAVPPGTVMTAAGTTTTPTGGNPTFQVTKRVLGATYDPVTGRVTMTIELTNTGAGTWTASVRIFGNLTFNAGPFTYDVTTAPTTLAPGATTSVILTLRTFPPGIGSGFVDNFSSEALLTIFTLLPPSPPYAF
jgi:hypothetical protein